MSLNHIHKDFRVCDVLFVGNILLRVEVFYHDLLIKTFRRILEFLTLVFDKTFNEFKSLFLKNLVFFLSIYLLPGANLTDHKNEKTQTIEKAKNMNKNIKDFGDCCYKYCS